MSPIFLSGLLFLYSVTFEVAAQIRFICPRPQSAQSNITQGPCGENSFKTDFFTDFTDVSPGDLTIHWEDTAPSYGRPTRVSLGEWGEKVPCVLIDRISHNDNDTVFRPPTCEPNSYPLGGCQESGTYLTINLPNINCTRCYLQIASIVTDDRPCIFDDSNPSNTNCTVFYSCANIRISPSTREPEGIQSCENVTIPAHQWPNPVRYLYKGNTTGTTMAGQLIEFTETADPAEMTSLVEYVINFRQVIFPQVTELSLYFLLGDKQSAQFLTLWQGATYGVYAGSIPFPVRDVLRDALHNNKWFLRFTFLPTAMFPVASMDTYLLQSGQIYTAMHGVYSPGGWLRGASFVGPSSVLTHFVQPAGTCSPEVETFGSLLYDKTEETVRAILTYFVFEDTLFLTGAFASPLSEKWILQLQSRHRPDAKIIFEPQMDGNVLHVSLDLTAFLLSNAGLPPYKVEAKGTVGIERLWLRPLEKDKRVVSTPIYDSDGYIVGLSTLAFRETTWTITGLLINPSNRVPFPPDVSLRGPITPGFQGALLQNFPSSLFDNAFEIGGWVLQSTYSKTDTIFQQYLWLGLLTVVWKAGNDVFGGKFGKVTEPICSEVPSSFICKVTTLAQAEIPHHLGIIAPTSGIVTFGLNERTETLTYSITIRDLRKREKVVDAFFMRNAERLGFISSLGFRTSFWNDRTIVSTGNVLLSPELYEGLRKGDIYVGITTERPEEGRNASRTDIQGVLPLFQAFAPTTVFPAIPQTSAVPVGTTVKKDVATCTTLNYARANIFLARVHLCW